MDPVYNKYFRMLKMVRKELVCQLRNALAFFPRMHSTALSKFRFAGRTVASSEAENGI